MSAACSHVPSCAQRPRWEVADVFRLYGEAYRRHHALSASHLAVMHAIEVCRTPCLGGHVERCDACGFERPAYNSCRNRHCPKCQALAKARWLEARERELLPVEYFHTVFALPHALNPLALANKKAVYDILFHGAAETLHEFAADPKHGLAAKIGFTAILHTWDQKLLDHIHLHCLIPGGALSRDGQRWTPAREGFLFPVKALSEVFRGKFLAYLGKTFAAGELQFPGKTAPLGPPRGIPHAHPGPLEHPLGRLHQVVLPRTRERPRLPRPLHPSGRHPQPSHQAGRLAARRSHRRLRRRKRPLIPAVLRASEGLCGTRRSRAAVRAVGGARQLLRCSSNQSKASSCIGRSNLCGPG